MVKVAAGFSVAGMRTPPQVHASFEALDVVKREAVGIELDFGKLGLDETTQSRLHRLMSLLRSRLRHVGIRY